MLLWLVFHPDGTFEDDASKEALSTDITKIYTGIGWVTSASENQNSSHQCNSLPAFYVVVNFIKMPGNTMWVGGKKLSKDRPFVRVAIEHIAVTLANEDKAYQRTANAVDGALKPHVADKGYDYEFHIDETERRLWKINGMFPPAYKSEEEKIWVEENRAVPFEKGSL